MLETVTYKNKFEGVEYIKYPYEYLQFVINITKDKKEDYVQKAIKEIDGASFDGSDFISKFNGAAFSIVDISDGAKTAIYIGYCVKNNCYKDKAIDITSCGANAIKYILREYGDKDLKLVLRHLNLPRDVNITFKFEGCIVNNTSEISIL